MSVHHEIARHLPIRAARMLDAAGGADEATRLCGPAAVLFSDISGFSRVADRLAGDGDGEGIDRLTAILDERFGAWVDLVERHGGEVVRFAGDAVLGMWWAGEAPGPDLRTACGQAAACGLAIADSLEDEEIVGVPLSLRVALLAGPAVLGRLGGVGDRWELVLAGPVMQQLASTLGVADRGAVVASPEAWDLLQPRARGQLLAGGHHRLSHVPEAPIHSADVHSLEPSEMDRFRRYLPQVVRQHVERQLTAFLAEHRHLTVLFVRLAGGLASDPESFTAFHELVRGIQKRLDQAGGVLDKVLADDKGTMLVAAFGLPGPGLGYRPRAALSAALEVLEMASEAGLAATLGLATGKVFVGPIGGVQRREYTMIGNVVNLAARLASTKGNAVVCDGATHRMLQAQAHWEELPAQALKGLRERVVAYQALSMAEATEGAPLVGRADELARLHALVDDLGANDCRVLLLHGEAGVGKSRLAQAFAEHCRELALPMLQTAGSPARRDTAYAAWSPLVEQVLQLPSGSAAERRDAVLRALDEQPTLRSRAPLLEEVLGVGLEDNEETSRLQGFARADATRGFLGELLATLREKVALVVEDAQWLDGTSATLLADLARTGRGLVLLATTRPPEPVDPLADLRKLEGVEDLELGGLDAAGIEALLLADTGEDRAEADLVTWLAQRSGGNPFVCRETLRALADQDVLIRRKGVVLALPEALDSLELPATVEGLVTARVDPLDPRAQVILKTGAVAGLEFGRDTLRSALPHTTTSEFEPILEELVDSGLLEEVDEDHYAFPHALVRDVLYSSLVGSQRRAAHQSIAKSLEAEEDQQRLYPQLAHHWGGARDLPRALHYLELAGDRAFEIGTCEEARSFFGRALELAERFPDEVEPIADSIRRSRWWRRMGRSCNELGLHADADAAFRSSLAEVGHAPPSSGGAWSWLFVKEAVKQLVHRKLGWLPGVPGRSTPEVEEATRTTRWLMEPALFVYDSPLVYPAVVFWHLNLADRAPQAQTGGGLSAGGIILGGMGMHAGAARYFERAREVARSDLWDQLYTVITEVMYLGLFARWDEVDALQGDVRAAAEAIGHERGKRLVDLTDGLWQAFRGRFAAAEASLARAVDSATRRRQPMDEFNALAPLSWVQLEQGRDREAAEGLERLEVLATPESFLYWRIFVQALRASTARRADDPEGVRHAAEAALELAAGGTRPEIGYVFVFSQLTDVVVDACEAARAGGQPEPALEAAARRFVGLLKAQVRAFPMGEGALLLARGRLLAMRGKVGKARDLLEAAVELGRERTMPFDTARGLAALGSLSEGADREVLLGEARGLFDELHLPPRVSETDRLLGPG